MDRAANELYVSLEVLADMLKSGEHHYQIKLGPANEAMLTGIRFDHRMPWVAILCYDRYVPEKCLVESMRLWKRNSQ